MALTYLGAMVKLQDDGLEALKKAQDAYVESLSSMRELVEKMPASASVPPATELPTIPQILDLNARFFSRALEQQQLFGKQLVELFAPLKKAES